MACRPGRVRGPQCQLLGCLPVPGLLPHPHEPGQREGYPQAVTRAAATFAATLSLAAAAAATLRTLIN